MSILNEIMKYVDPNLASKAEKFIETNGLINNNPKYTADIIKTQFENENSLYTLTPLPVLKKKA